MLTPIRKIIKCVNTCHTIWFITYETQKHKIQRGSERNEQTHSDKKNG